MPFHYYRCPGCGRIKEVHTSAPPQAHYPVCDGRDGRPMVPQPQEPRTLPAPIPVVGKRRPLILSLPTL